MNYRYSNLGIPFFPLLGLDFSCFTFRFPDFRHGLSLSRWPARSLTRKTPIIPPLCVIRHLRSVAYGLSEYVLGFDSRLMLIAKPATIARRSRPLPCHPPHGTRPNVTDLLILNLLQPILLYPTTLPMSSLHLPRH